MSARPLSVSAAAARSRHFRATCSSDGFDSTSARLGQGPAEQHPERTPPLPDLSTLDTDQTWAAQLVAALKQSESREAWMRHAHEIIAE